MKTTATNLIVIVSILTVCIAGTATASNKNNNKKNNFSIGFSFGSSPNWNVYNHHPHVKKVYVAPKYVYEKCYYPLHRICFVLPGDTWYTIAQREYGSANLCHYIASYNGLSMSTQLFVGQQIRLPEIHPNGVLRASTAPIAQFVPTTPVITQNLVAPALNAVPTAPAATIRQASDVPSIPSLAVGSTIVLEGQTLGTDKGIVRLRLSEVALPVEVLEWTNSSAKVRLPEMELTSAMRADLEVLRADGSLASKSPVQLTLGSNAETGKLAVASTSQGN